MTSNGNQSQRIYDKATRTWYEVPEDQYKEFDRWRTNLRKREQYRGRCFCPRGKWWLATATALTASFIRATRPLLMTSCPRRGDARRLCAGRQTDSRGDHIRPRPSGTHLPWTVTCVISTRRGVEQGGVSGHVHDVPFDADHRLLVHTLDAAVVVDVEKNVAALAVGERVHGLERVLLRHGTASLELDGQSLSLLEHLIYVTNHRSTSFQP